MKLRFLTALLFLFLAACAGEPATQGSVDTGSTEPISDADKQELVALQRIGDVRVYWYQKASRVESTSERGKFIEQSRQVHILINRGHSYFAGITDYAMKEEERFLYSTDMHDLLVNLRDHRGSYNQRRSINIKGDAPIKRADRETTAYKMIAVEQIKDGKVNTSYFARYRGEEEDKSKFDRVATFNKCLAIVMQATGQAVPRGSTGVGPNQGRDIGPNRR
jgi:hypothetical protein